MIFPYCHTTMWFHVLYAEPSFAGGIQKQGKAMNTSVYGSKIDPNALDNPNMLLKTHCVLNPIYKTTFHGVFYFPLKII